MISSLSSLDLNTTTAIAFGQYTNITSNNSTNESYYGAGPVFPAYIRPTATVLCSLIMGIGVLGNVMVPIVIFKSKDMRNSTNVFLMNLSFADLMVLLVCTPTVLVEVNSRPETWVLGEEMCKAVPFIEMMVTHASVLTILAISFERYYAICEPLKAGYICTKTRAFFICLCAWLLAGLLTSPIVCMTDYSYEEYIDGTNVSVCQTLADTFWSKTFFLGGTLIFFAIPLAILVILYSVIAVNLMTHPGIVPVTRQDSSSSAHRYRKQVIMMLGTVVIFFFVCLLPFRALIVWIVLAPHEEVMKLGNEGYYNLLYFCRIMFYLNSAINPILYNLMSSKFRNGFLKVCGLKKNCFRKHTRALLRNSTFNTSSLTHTSAITTSSIHRTSINDSERKKSLSRSSKKEQSRHNSCSKSLIFNNNSNNLKSSLKNYLTKDNCDINQTGSDRDKCHFKFIKINRKRIRRRKSFSDFLVSCEEPVSVINHSNSLDSIFKAKQCHIVPRLSKTEKTINNNTKYTVRFTNKCEDAISYNKKIISKHISDTEGINISEDQNRVQNGCDPMSAVKYSKDGKILKSNEKFPGLIMNKQLNEADQVFSYRIVPASAFKMNKSDELKESFV